MSDDWAADGRIDPDWRRRTITLTADRDTPPATKGMRLAFVFDNKREIYEVDAVKRGPIGWDLNVTLIKTQLPTKPQATS